MTRAVFRATSDANVLKKTTIVQHNTTRKNKFEWGQLSVKDTEFLVQINKRRITTLNM